MKTATFRSSMSSFRAIDPKWAWDEYNSNPQEPWDLKKAAHLYRRAAFAPGYGDLSRALEDGPAKTITALLTPPEGLGLFHSEYDTLLKDAARTQGWAGIRAWWLRRMMESPFPLEEKLTLFWHTHFAIAGDRVGDPALLTDYLIRLRQKCRDSWEDILAEVALHPTFLLSGGAPSHRKMAPNIHWAKVFCDHVALGPHNHRVLKPEEVARVWTGWFVLNKKLRFIPTERDTDPKTIFDQTGDLTVAELVQLVGRHPLSQEFIVRKLYQYFVSDEHSPPPALLRPLVELLETTNSVHAVVERILRSNLFFSPLAYRAKIKSPVELVVGLARSFESLIPTAPLGEELASAGQDLCNPPSFEGWPAGKHWIHQGTYLARKRLLKRIVGGPTAQSTLDPWKTAQKYQKASIRDFPKFLAELLYQHDLEPCVEEALQKRWNSLTQIRPFAPGQAAKILLTEFLLLPEYELT